MGYFSQLVNLRVPHAKISNFLSGSVLVCLALPSIAAAEEPQNTEVDCGSSEIRYVDDPTLTRQERLARMQQAFFDSVNRFEACELSSQSSASGGDNAGDAGSGAEDGTGASENAAAASQAMQGTEEEAETFPDSPSGQGSVDEETEIPPGQNTASASADNGAIPEDIPQANNDDAVAAQIRIAAENETDPDIREKLWNEYRKYKGMQVVE